MSAATATIIPLWSRESRQIVIDRHEHFLRLVTIIRLAAIVNIYARRSENTVFKINV